MNSPRAPLPVARAAVGLTARVLRGPAARARYRAEFLAELHELPPGGQLRYAAGVLSQALALRAALGAARSLVEEHAMTLTTHPAPPWRCRLLHLHRWVMRSTEDGERYQACALCGVDRGPVSAGMSSTPPWPGDL
jgi:hypothetical protein